MRQNTKKDVLVKGVCGFCSGIRREARRAKTLLLILQGCDTPEQFLTRLVDGFLRNGVSVNHAGLFEHVAHNGGKTTFHGVIGFENRGNIEGGIRINFLENLVLLAVSVIRVWEIFSLHNPCKRILSDWHVSPLDGKGQIDFGRSQPFAEYRRGVFPLRRRFERAQA